MIFSLFSIYYIIVVQSFSYEIKIQDLEIWSENFENCNLLIQFGFYGDFKKPGLSIEPKFTNKIFNFWDIIQPYISYDGKTEIKRKAEAILGTGLKWSLKCSAMWIFSPEYSPSNSLSFLYEPYIKLFTNLEAYIFTNLCKERDQLYKSSTSKQGTTPYNFLVCFESFEKSNKFDIIYKINGIIWFHYLSFHECFLRECVYYLNYFRKHSYREINFDDLNIQFLDGNFLSGSQIVIKDFNFKILDFSYIELYTIEIIRIAHEISNSTSQNELLLRYNIRNYYKIKYTDKSPFPTEYFIFDDFFVFENTENNFLTCSPLVGKSIDLGFFLSSLDTDTWLWVSIVTAILFLFLKFGFWIKKIKFRKSVFLNLLAPFLEQGMEFEEFLVKNPWLYMPMILWLFAFGIVIANGYKSFVTSRIIVPLNEKFPDYLDQLLDYKYYPIDFTKFERSKSINEIISDHYYKDNYRKIIESLNFSYYKSTNECLEKCSINYYSNLKLINNSIFTYESHGCTNSDHKCFIYHSNMSKIIKRYQKFIYLYKLFNYINNDRISRLLPYSYLINCKSSFLLGNSKVLSSVKNYFDEKLVNKKFILGQETFLSSYKGLFLISFPGHFFKDLIRYGIEYGILHFWEKKSTSNRVKEWENYKNNTFNISQEYPFKTFEPASLSSNIQSVFIIFAILISFCILFSIYEIIIFHRKKFVYLILNSFCQNRFFTNSAFAFYFMHYLKNLKSYFLNHLH